MPATRLILIALTAVFAMSMVPVLVKATAANELTIALARLGIAMLVFLPLAIRRGHLASMNHRQWLQLALIGVIFAIHWYAYFLSVKLSSPAVAALAVTTYGVQYLLLAWLFNGEKLGVVELLAVVACMVGCALVTPQLSLSQDVTRGLLVGLFSATLYALLPLLHQRAQAIPTTERTFGQFFFALLFFLPFASGANWELDGDDWLILLVLGLLCTVLAHGLWVKASTELPAIYTGMIYYLYLPLAALGSVIFLGEELTGRKLAGMALVISASVGVSLYRYQSSRVADS